MQLGEFLFVLRKMAEELMFEVSKYKRMLSKMKLFLEKYVEIGSNEPIIHKR